MGRERGRAYAEGGGSATDGSGEACRRPFVHLHLHLDLCRTTTTRQHHDDTSYIHTTRHHDTLHTRLPQVTVALISAPLRHKHLSSLSLIPHPSSLIPYPSSLIAHPPSSLPFSSLIGFMISRFSLSHPASCLLPPASYVYPETHTALIGTFNPQARRDRPDPS